MCSGGGGQQQVATPAPPPEVLTQPAPVVKQVDKTIDSAPAGGQTNDRSKTGSTPTANTNPLAIGTKKYRSSNGLNTTGLTIAQAPSGIKV